MSSGSSGRSETCSSSKVFGTLRDMSFIVAAVTSLLGVGVGGGVDVDVGEKRHEQYREQGGGSRLLRARHSL